eukprot:NODE_3564_length_953_cov_21.084071_g3274_i0.p1 GENE.NODE_3564_length_953_cov_21.084071_g3274_i0~~NODE_3564_length_953_cov_21.084071_g3274_i0.p1  ORF type:complete len:205 (+),score=30.85 NODE_3564_length_953_cov_21.084071_g3274_i0:124-738(+)
MSWALRKREGVTRGSLQELPPDVAANTSSRRAISSPAASAGIAQRVPSRVLTPPSVQLEPLPDPSSRVVRSLRDARVRAIQPQETPSQADHMLVEDLSDDEELELNASDADHTGAREVTRLVGDVEQLQDPSTIHWLVQNWRPPVKIVEYRRPDSAEEVPTRPSSRQTQALAQKPGTPPSTSQAYPRIVYNSKAPSETSSKGEV